MTKVTLDTNVLISATFWTGDSFRILEMIEQKKIICALSKDILSEYQKVIGSDEIVVKISDKGLRLSKIVQRVIFLSEIVDPIQKIDVLKEDPTDNKILECAMGGKSDYIITNDNHLLKIREYGNIRIVTPKEFIENCAGV